MKLRTTMLTSAFASLIAVASCSEDTSKKVHPTVEAGAAGEAGEAHQSGGAAGEGGVNTGGTSVGGVGGADAPSSGAAGSEVGAIAGEGGAPISASGPLFLFTVDATSVGLQSSAVAASANPQSVIFASSTANPDPVSGSNVARITGAQLGLADTDTIDAFAALQPAPSHPLYWFSVATNSDGAEGERPTRLTRSSVDGEDLADVYFSDGTLSFRSLGEGGDQLGYNGLVADEQSLGLAPDGTTERQADNLTGVALLPDGQLPSTLYFSVSARSAGLAGSAVAATAVAERGCTIFKSALDGHDSVAYSCADLGLGANSQLSGLVVYGTAAPSEVLFAVARGATGLTGTGVEAAANAASDVFASPLDGTNALRVEGGAFGLSTTDQLDALAVVDRKPPSAAYASTCALTPAPLTPEGANITSFESAHQLGKLLLIHGPGTATAAPIDRVGAYDLSTCAFVARSSVASQVLQGQAWAPVPLADWSATAPFTKLEYWALASDGSGISRLDASGTLLASYAFANSASSRLALSLDYDAAHDRFFAVFAPQTGFELQRLTFLRPSDGTANGSVLANVQTPIPHPCGSASLSGVDAQGNSSYAQRDTGTAFRVCALDAAYGEFAELPFTLSFKTQAPDYAAWVPGDAIYALLADSTFSVERYTVTP